MPSVSLGWSPGRSSPPPRRRPPSRWWKLPVARRLGWPRAGLGAGARPARGAVDGHAADAYAAFGHGQQAGGGAKPTRRAAPPVHAVRRRQSTLRLLGAERSEEIYPVLLEEIVALGFRRTLIAVVDFESGE